MFLSVIIPLHNAERTIERLLNSIKLQDFDDFEVLIVDDNSTDKSIEIINSYINDLPIRVINANQEIHCPGNTRQVGLDNALGEWVTFIDHDDEFTSGAFKAIQSLILKDRLQYICCTLFTQMSEIENYCSDMVPVGEDALDNWLHGKFFNRKNIFEKYPDIRFKQDLIQLEDIYFMNKIINHLYCDKIINDVKLTYYSIYTYTWYCGINNTHANLVENKYTHNDWGLANNYCEIVFDNYTDMIKNAHSQNDFDVLCQMILSSLYYCYCAKQNFIEKYGKEDKIISILQDTIERKTWIVWQIGIKDTDLLNCFYNCIEQHVHPEWEFKYLYDDPLIWLGNLKESYFNYAKELGIVQEQQ